MNWIKEMITSPRGAVSSKRVIGSVSYIALSITVIVLCFVNPSFKNLDDILETLIFAGTTMPGSIFPSKEERNWDRFRPKEPTYKPCESAEQFADLFLGAKVKSKKEESIVLLYTITGIFTPDFWFKNYTLLDGTPLEPAPGTGTTANAPEGGDAWQDVLGTD